MRYDVSNVEDVLVVGYDEMELRCELADEVVENALPEVKSELVWDVELGPEMGVDEMLMLL